MKWPLVNLDTICRPKQWPTISGDQLLSDGYPVYGANGKIGFYSAFTHADPTVLITCRGATCGTINICEPHSYVTGNAMALDGLDPRVDLRFLCYALRVRGLSDVISGSAQPQITREGLRKVKIPLPPIEEQRRIAAILDQAEALRTKRRQALTTLDTLTESLFLEMFGDPVSNSRGWQARTVGEALSAGVLVAIQDGNHGEIHPKAEDFTETGIPFITANCLVDGGLDLARCKRLPDRFMHSLRIGFAQPGDVLLSHKGTVGATVVVPRALDRLILSPQVTYYRTNALILLPSFLTYLFRTDVFQRLLAQTAEQSTRAYIGITRQQGLPLIIPALESQRRFAAVVAQVEKLKCDEEAAGRRSSQLFHSLQNRAFQGDL